MAEYYRIAIVPARVRRPQDKGSVEMMVGVIERQAIAPLRNKLFFDLADLNSALMVKLEEINARKFQKKEGSRESLYLGQEKSMLTPLPPTPYEYVIRKRVTVNFNYHILFDGAWYSVPYHYVKKEVDIVASKVSIAINCDGKRIALHTRSYYENTYNTNQDHMPQSHQDFLEWNSDKMRHIAEGVGPATLRAINALLSSKKIEQQAYQSCRLTLRLKDKYSPEILEEACSKALIYSSYPSYKSIKAIAVALSKQVEPNQNAHAYLRGATYYQQIEDSKENE